MWYKFCNNKVMRMKADCGLKSYIKQLMKSCNGDTSLYSDLNMNKLDKDRMHYTSEPIVSRSKMNDLNKQRSGVQLNDVKDQFRKHLFKQNSDGDTQLHLSIIMNYVEASLWLISKASHRSYLNIVNDESQSPLHLAVMAREPRIVRTLVLAGANVELKMRDGNTPMHLACALNDLACLKAFIEPVSLLEEEWLMSNNNVQDLPILSQNLELRNYDGNTCLHLAASKGNLDIVSLLIRSGANPDAREGRAGMTALHIAIENGNKKLVRYLACEGRASLHTVTYAGTTPCQLALDFDRFQIAEDLLRVGASFHIVNNKSSDNAFSSCFDSESDSCSSGNESEDSSM